VHRGARGVRQLDHHGSAAAVEPTVLDSCAGLFPLVSSVLLRQRDFVLRRLDENAPAGKEQMPGVVATLYLKCL